MTWSSRDRVLASFAHEEPDRVPCWCGASPEFWEKAKRELCADDEGLRQRFGDDFRRVTAPYVGPTMVCSSMATSQTIFGVERAGLGYGQPLAHPLAGATLRQVHEYPWPDPNWVDVSQVRRNAEVFERKYAILGGDWSPFWHDVIDLMGMETMYLAMYDQPEVVEAIFQHVVDYYAAVNERIFEVAGDHIDIFFLGNDFGSQTGPLLSEDLFGRFIMPHLARLAELGHAAGMKVLLHCCGGIAQLMPAMIEAGIDGLHAVQPCCEAMEPRRLKEAFGKKLLFSGAIDSHHVLLDGTPETVRQSTEAILRIMATGGGYVAGASHDTILEETPVENVVAMFDAVRAFRL